MRLPPFKLERFFEQHEFNVPFLLCVSDCQTTEIKNLLKRKQDARKEFLNLQLGYIDTKGGQPLREGIATLYQGIGPQEILAGTGAEELIFLFMNTCLSKGDHVIVQTPCYQSLIELPRALGCHVTPWPCRRDAGWAPDLDFLADCAGKQTRAIIINSPHNPTGFHFNAEELRQIIEIAQANRTYLFSDEVYRYLEYEESDRLPACADEYERAVSLGVLSKSFGLAGLRLGWVASREPSIIQSMAALKDYTTICNSSPSEFLGLLALENAEKILDRNRRIVLSNLKALTKFMNEYKETFSWIPPKAGCLAFPALREVTDPVQWFDRLRKEKGVLLLPGGLYDMDPSHFRIGFGRRDFRTGLAHLREFCRSHLRFDRSVKKK